MAHPPRLARLIILCLAVAMSAVVPAAAAPSDKGQGRTTYYVALGDSLAQGFMPGLGDTDQGYVDRLYEELRASDPDLALVKLGCSGETVVTLVSGGRCDYGDAGSQLAAAVDFLREHRGKVEYVTIDIGANNVARCVRTGAIDMACIAAGLGAIDQLLPQALADVRAAGGGRPTYAGMTYYNPFLAAWLLGPPGQALAVQSLGLLRQVNGIETAAFDANRFRVARVDEAFRSEDFTPISAPGLGTVPINVATICTLTFMCVRNDIHANPAGYQLLADTFADVITPRGLGHHRPDVAAA